MNTASEPPGFLKKRKHLYNEKTPDEQRTQTGRLLMDAGRYDDALEFFVRCADARQHVHAIAQIAARECNVPVYLRAMAILKEPPDASVLEQLAERALQADRASMAVLAYQRAGQADRAREVHRLLFGDRGTADDDNGCESADSP